MATDCLFITLQTFAKTYMIKIRGIIVENRKNWTAATAERLSRQGNSESYLRHSMWGVCLDVDFKGDFVIVNEAPLWISHILKHRNAKTVKVNNSSCNVAF